MDLQIGQRVACDGEYCTVRYIGTVEGTEGEWIGVEWDNTNRGRHNGSYNGIRYFTTREPVSGSFVRRKKISVGIPCPEAIRQHYGIAENLNIKNIPKTGVNDREIEYVGIDKVCRQQGQYDKLRNIGLENWPVNSAGLNNELGQLVPNVTELHLAHTLLSSWSEVAKIAEQLPHLRFLNLSKNELLVPENPEALQQSFQHVETLILNRIGYTWNQVLTCAVMWTNIKCLELVGNRITSLQAPDEGVFSVLEELVLADNAIGSWDEVCKLGHLPNLHALNVMNASISSVCFDGIHPTDKTSLFSCLRKLNLASNNLSTWQDIAELNKLHSLENLIVVDNPVMVLDKFDTVFQCIIAKIENVKKVNHMQVTAKMRRDAEIDYLKRYYKQWIKSSEAGPDSNVRKPSLEFLSEHPRYPKLAEVHGLPEDSEVAERSSLLKNSLISVEISNPSLPDKPAVKRKLPNTMTVGKVKMLVKRLFNASTEPQLFCKNPELGSREVELDNDLKELHFYSVSNGDQILAKW